MASVNRSYRALNVTLNILLALIIGMLLIITYWYFEPDPLTVNYAPTKTNWSECTDRRWTMTRDVKATKDLTVHIKEYWWELDGMRDINGKMNEYPNLALTTYTLTAGTDRLFEFPKLVPKDLPAGRYRYRPHAEYKVNPIKTIRRDLPIQYVQVKCDYDKSKHGEMP